MNEKVTELSKLLESMIEAGMKMVESASVLKELLIPEPNKNEQNEMDFEPIPDYEPVKKELSKTDVRALLVEKSNLCDGKYKAQVKALVKKYSKSGTFSSINPNDYENLVAELEEIDNA
ncbi:MAG: hypothetical protein LIO62_06070 [Clostridiales bacterium]|nr:hypothetical protein [Clostridiales bacterium]